MKRAIAAIAPFIVVTCVAAQVTPMASHPPRRLASPEAGVAAFVNDAAIRADEVDAAMNAIMPLTSYHQNLKPEKLAELRSRAIEALIDEELRYQESLRLKVRVSRGEIDEALARARKSYRSDEEFERARRAAGATVPQVRASMSRALMIQKAYEQEIGSRCRMTESGAAAFYRENTQRFMLPEQIRASLITVGVNPSASRQEWERAKQKAGDLGQQINGGAAFDALARQYSTDPSRDKGGDLGFVHRGQLIDEFERALHALSPGQVSPVIQTIYGFHLLRLVEVRPAAQKTFADVKTTLIRDLTESRCSEASADWSKRLRARARITIVAAGSGARTPG